MSRNYQDLYCKTSSAVNNVTALCFSPHLSYTFEQGLGTYPKSRLPQRTPQYSAQRHLA